MNVNQLTQKSIEAVQAAQQSASERGNTEVTQQHLTPLADATGDHQWIHVDAERAKAGPFGNTIAHGLHIAKIAASGPIKSGVNPRYSLPIFQARQPALESFALDNFKHAQSVTHE